MAIAAQELTLDVAEFKAKSLGLFDQLSRGEIVHITVTKQGKPVATVSPPVVARRMRFEDIHGCMARTAFVPPGLDLTQPTMDPDWETEWLASWDRQMK